jgi:hypothetical protein
MAADVRAIRRYTGWILTILVVTVVLPIVLAVVLFATGSVTDFDGGAVDLGGGTRQVPVQTP